MLYSLPSLVVTALIISLGLAGCGEGVRSPAPATVSPSPSALASPVPDATPTGASPEQRQQLKQSWQAYRQRFIQADGRVIDWEAAARSTSEGQAYAMLRSVLVDDPKTFALTLAWGEKNLRRQTQGQQIDHLWAWKWGESAAKTWEILDSNFASDGDLDAITALILASRRWNRPEYLQLAQAKLRDVWTLATIAVGNQRYLMPGPQKAFQQASLLQLNPSYLAPYAFRLFAQVDAGHDWMSLVTSSYQVLEQSSALSTVGLPSDWVTLDTQTRRFAPLPESSPLRSHYSFDAYRVWWRVSLDAAWFNAPEAKSYLRQHLGYLQTLWKSQQRLPARIDLQGNATVTYEALAQYGALYSAFQWVDPAIAEQIYQQKLSPLYREGFWENHSAYYTQNIVWFGLVPATTLAPNLLQPIAVQSSRLPPIFSASNSVYATTRLSNSQSRFASTTF